MNRSLEALAILVICLVGILAALRISTKDSAADGRTMAEQSESSSNLAPAATSPAIAGLLPSAGVEPELAAVTPQYDASCGLDRQTGEVYSPLKPLLSPAEFAARSIRSQPLPLIVLPAKLPEAVLSDSDRTGYDQAYDTAIFGESPEAAQAVDAAAKNDPPVATELFRSSLLVPWLREQAQAWGNLTVGNLQHVQLSYVPTYRAIHARWTEQVAPRLRHFPRPNNTARQDLLRRQQAAASSQPSLNWNDYLAFANRELASRIESKSNRVATQQTPTWLQHASAALAEACNLAERLLHGAGEEFGRVAREPEDDDLWRAR